jgi:hypothetical protein
VSRGPCPVFRGESSLEVERVFLTQRSQRAQRRVEENCGLTGWMAALISTDGAESAHDSMRGTCCEDFL